MRAKLMEALVKHAVDDYNQQFEAKYKIKEASMNQLIEWIEQYDGAAIAYWSYCCRGMFANCWIDEYSKGTWGMKKEDVVSLIIGAFEEREKQFNREHRIAIYESEDAISILLIGRDLKKYKKDCIILLYNEEEIRTGKIKEEE